VQELRDIIEESKKPKKLIRILDVRPKTEFGICHLPRSIRKSSPLHPDSHPRFEFANTLAHLASIDIPLYDLVANPGDYACLVFETYVVCRLGNDSQIAADALRSVRPEDPTLVIKDLVGGLRAWSRDVDPGFPIY
jgi:adenylyltransferase/sulfurtransferase